MKTKEKQIDYVWKFLEGEMSGEELKIFKDELKTNEELVKCYEQQSEIFKALQKTETIELRKQLSNIVQEPQAPYHVRSTFNSRMLWYLAAASVVILISLGYIIFSSIMENNQSLDDSNGQMAGKDTQVKIEENRSSQVSQNSIGSNSQSNDSNTSFYPPTNYFDTTIDKETIYDELYAVVYQENPMLESLLDLNYRSEIIDLYLPEPEQTYSFDDTIVFYWKPEVDTALYLTIINNRSIEIYNSKLKGRNLIFSQKLSPGLYYWKINTEKDNLFNGKILIN